VRRIEGSVIGDESRYDRERYVPGWPARYLDQNTIGPLSALSVNDGFTRYPTREDTATPPTPAPDPALDAAAVLERLLEARGIVVTGAPAAGVAPSGAVEVAAIESVPLVDVVAQLLRESDNSTAELLLKELGRTADAATTAGGAAVVAEVVEPFGEPVIADGSGLSPDNRVSCKLLVGLLTRDGTGQVIAEQLAVAGVSGTLTDRFVGTDLEGVLRAKTGSLRNVAALAGVVEDDDPALTFAFVVNGEPLPEHTADLQQAVAEALASWPRVADVEALGPQTEGR
jgi:D-alanyl-D-alanine carboxypeptidase/D-alanyl-D-alanine-endopeptidase (penicillin-binding protein 4)